MQVAVHLVDVDPYLLAPLLRMGPPAKAAKAAAWAAASAAPAGLVSNTGAGTCVSIGVDGAPAKLGEGDACEGCKKVCRVFAWLQNHTESLHVRQYIVRCLYDVQQQVLDELGVTGRILDVVKSLYET